MILSSNSKACEHFMKLQTLVQPQSSSNGLDSSHEFTNERISNDDKAFVKLRRFSHGDCSDLDLVRNKQTGIELIRKSFWQSRERGSRNLRTRRIQQDIVALRKVGHPHLARIVGTYQGLESNSVLFAPAPNSSLKSLLTIRNSFHVVQGDLQNLPEYFGCLANAVAFLHANNFCLDTLSPENILLEDGQVIVCDLSVLNDELSSTRSLEVRPTFDINSSYAAPEVKSTRIYSEPSNIWSLGRVYLDMLTVLGGQSLEDMNDYLTGVDASNGENGSPRGSPGDPLQEWLQRLRVHDDYLELKALTFQMLSKRPHDRPNINSVVMAIRQTSSHFTCASCADSEMLMTSLSVPRRSLQQEECTGAGAEQGIYGSESNRRKSEADAARKRSLSLSAHQPNMRGFESVRFSSSSSNGSRDNSMATYRNPSLEYSLGGDMLIRQDSVMSDYQPWRIRENEVLDIETRLLSYCIRQGEPSLYKEAGIEGGAMKLYLYRSICSKAWEATRRLVIVDPDGETQTTRIYSNWLPLADLGICLYDGTITLSWSDCNHNMQEPTINYVETHSKRYDARKPNSKIEMKIASSATSSTNALALVHALCSPHVYDSGRTTRRPDKQMRLNEGELVGLFKALKEGQQDMMIVVGRLSEGTTTKLYCIPERLDLSVATRLESDIKPATTTAARQGLLYQAVVSGLLTPNYLSDAEHLSKTMNRKGMFREAVCIPRRAVFTFAKDNELFEFLEAITGWKLVFLARLKSLKEKRTLWHDLNAADMLLWQRGGRGNVAVTFRLHKDSGVGKWMSGLLPRDNILKKTEGVEATLALRGTSVGDVLERRCMKAVTSKKRTGSNEKPPDADKTTSYRMVFKNEPDLAEFRSVIEECIRTMSLSPDVSPKSA
ncbi:hypothetical protein AAFC00_000173 [Neodothiora populina]